MTQPTHTSRPRTRSRIAGLILTAVFFAIIGVTVMQFGVEFLGYYGFGLFLGLPFLGGVSFALLRFGRFEDPDVIHTKSDTLLFAVADFVLFTTAILGTFIAVLLLCNLEGIVCVLMALPIAVPLAAMGVGIGHAMLYGSTLLCNSQGARRLVILLGAAILLGGMTVEPQLLDHPPLRKVVTAVEVRGDIQDVWDTVIAFPEITAPPTGILAWGIAYPIAAEIEGSGVGAIRRCRFNTGDFVEPITAWEEPYRLAFDVTENPVPMTEIGLYDSVDPPHLHGFMISERGQFRLQELPDGRVLLEGTTWYHHDLWPNFYWGFLSDQIIHRIHLRVLDHIKASVEGPTA
jgi:hypothetical protein